MSKILANGWLSKPITCLFQDVTLQAPESRANTSQLLSKINKSNKSTFNTPHPPKDPPENYNPSCVNHEAFDVPEFIPASVFRPFSSKCESLGPGADKRGCYKNPEYYSYHRYSFVALQLVCLKLREQRKKEANIRCLYDDENSDDEKYSSDEDKK